MLGSTSLSRCRLFAGILISLALVLPVSKCGRANPDGTYAYGYVVKESAKVISEEYSSPHPSATRIIVLAVVPVAAVLWPLAAALRRKERQGWRRIAALVITPIGIAASWVYSSIQAMLIGPGSGWFALTAGFALYLGTWATECVLIWLQCRQQARGSGRNAPI